MVAAVFCIAIEAFNTVRALFLSNSGLSTLNNRIYFGFYVFLLITSVLYFFFVSMLGKKPGTGNAVCLVYAGIVLLWNTCVNVYDIVRSSGVHAIMGGHHDDHLCGYRNRQAGIYARQYLDQLFYLYDGVVDPTFFRRRIQLYHHGADLQYNRFLWDTGGCVLSWNRDVRSERSVRNWTNAGCGLPGNSTS